MINVPFKCNYVDNMAMSVNRVFKICTLSSKMTTIIMSLQWVTGSSVNMGKRI